MGEIADMIIEGGMCACGEIMGDGSMPGYPRYCSAQCRRDYGGPEEPVVVLNRDGAKDPKTIMCGYGKTEDHTGCTRMFRTKLSLAHHVASKHLDVDDDTKPNSPSDLGFG